MTVITFETRPVTDPDVIAHLEAAKAAEDSWARMVWLSGRDRRKHQNLRMRPHRDREGNWYFLRHRSPLYITACEVSIHDGKPTFFSFRFS